MTTLSVKVHEIDVKVNTDGEPVSFKRNGQAYRIISIYDRWRIADGWWAEEIRRDCFRIETRQGLVYDIYHDMVANRWYLSKLQG